MAATGTKRRAAAAANATCVVTIGELFPEHRGRARAYDTVVVRFGPHAKKLSGGRGIDLRGELVRAGVQLRAMRALHFDATVEASYFRDLLLRHLFDAAISLDELRFGARTDQSNVLLLLPEYMPTPRLRTFSIAHLDANARRSAKSMAFWCQDVADLLRRHAPVLRSVSLPPETPRELWEEALRAPHLERLRVSVDGVVDVDASPVPYALLVACCHAPRAAHRAVGNAVHHDLQQMLAAVSERLPVPIVPELILEYALL